MNIFSRRKRLLTRTSKPPKMSSRRQFHRALRRHPAWPMVMAEAAARAKLHKEQEAARAKLQKEEAVARARARKASNRERLRRRLRRNRVLLVTLLAVGGLVVLLNGIGAANLGDWKTHHTGFDGPLPPARMGMASAYDRINKEILMFGGFGAAAGQPVPEPPDSVPGSVDPAPGSVSPVLVPESPVREVSTGALVALNDTWGQNTNRKVMWTNRSSVNRPSARGFASMAFDVARNNMVLFGGAPYRSNAVSNETWTWDGVDWTLRNPPGPRPPARQNAVMVYDAHRRNVVLFGGRGADGKPIGETVNHILLGDTWIWDGSAWEKQTPAVSPRGRHSAAMAYDICRGEAVMFGGTIGNARSSIGRETWAWDGTKWIDRSAVANNVGDPSNRPIPRYGASMTYSYLSGRLLLYGGFPLPHYTDSLFDQVGGGIPVATDENIWSWDGATWRKEIVSPIHVAGRWIEDSHLDHTPPSPRAYSLFTYQGLEPGGYKGTLFPKTPTSLFGGTPADPNPAPQLLSTDHHTFGEDTATDLASPVFGTTGCLNPIPLPVDEALTGDQGSSARKTVTREEIRELDRLPALVGTPWPDANRNPAPNPKYTPPPDCPRRDSELAANTHLATDSKRNRVYQFFVCDPNRGGSGAVPAVDRLLIRAYDGTTLKPLGSAIVPMKVVLPDSTDRFSEMVLHDIDRGRFLIRVQKYNGSNYDNELWVIQQDLIEKGVDPLFKTYPLPSPTPPDSVPGANISGPTLTGGGTISEVGFFNHPKTGLPKALLSITGINPAWQITQGSNPSATPPKMVQWDLESNSRDWEAPLPACLPTVSFPVSRGYRAGDSVYTSCQISGDTNGGQDAVVWISVAESAGTETAGTPQVFPGPGKVARTWFDPQTCRMLLQSATYQPEGSSLWVWECESRRYVGRVGLAQTSWALSWGAGFDEATGRWYMLAPDHKAYEGAADTESNVVQGGLLVVDTRLTPVPAAENFAQFSYPSEPQIGILPSAPGLPRRIFIRRSGGQMPRYPDGEQVSLPNETHYKVLGDELPISEQARFDQQDALTIPVAPNDKTEVSFDAEASAYGMRLRRIGGIFTFSGTTDPPCFHPTRELMAGWVANAHLSDIEATARTVGLEADSATKQDLQGPGSRCLIPQDALNSVGGAGGPVYADTLYPVLRETLPQAETQTGPQLDWSKRFDDAECSGNSTTVTQTTGADVYGSATCEQRQARVEADARGSALGFTAGDNAFSVGEGGSNVVVAREAERGVVVTATAWATGIKLPGDVNIALVKTTAVAWSNGRPCTANCLPAPALDGHRASFERKICMGTSPSNSRCLTTDEQTQMMGHYNRMGSRGQMSFPGPDLTLLKGTPGGYLAGVSKPLAQEEEEKLFVRDLQKEVIGMRIMFTFDHATSPEKNFLDLAGVRAVTGFGVQCGPEYVYSPAPANSCVPLPEEVFPQDTFVEEEAASFEGTDGPELYASDGWAPVATAAPNRLALGQRLGRFIENLPVLRRLPIRQMGEALLAGSVWMLLGMPLFLASRRFALNLARRA